MNIKQSIGLSSLLLTSVVAYAGVSGTVFQDIPLNGTNSNTYGVKDNNEFGIGGIVVTSYPGGESATTSADGTWSLNTSGKVRIEFTNLPTHLKEGIGESSVQFIDGDATNIDLALYNPSEYAVGQSDIAMTIQANSSLTANNAVGLKVLTKDNIPASGEADEIPSNTSRDIDFVKLGTVWGLAYDSTHKNIYTSAVVRRHGAMGPSGLGAIYKIDENGNVSTFVTVENVGTITKNDDRNLSANASQPSHDTIFDEVGRVGLGDIDMSEDGKKLYAVNLSANTFVSIDMATKNQTAISIGNPFGAGCQSNDVKSWGIGQKDGEVYVGSVCTTDTAQGAYISKLNGSTFSTFHQIPLDMDGENSLDAGSSGNTNGTKRWRTWITAVADLFDGSGTRSSLPAPILSDIVFDENNGMIIGFADRTAMQAGVSNHSPTPADTNLYKYDAAGDIYRVCKSNGLYVNEGSAGCSQNDLVGNEFFTDDEWVNNRRHKEIALGGLTYVQGSHSVATSAFDPALIYDTSGIVWLSSETGTKIAGQRMVGNQGDLTYNGKAGGIGDLEILAPTAPMEIGDRVWFDANANCIQDANESGITGVNMTLYSSADCTGLAESTTQTDANGSYSFTVNAETEYSVCINDTASQSVLNDKNLTCNSGGTSIHNSDATLSNGSAKVVVAPLESGANNHSFDFGFAPVSVTPVPVAPVIPVTPTPSDNRTVDNEDGNCDCHAYEESSSPSLNPLGMFGLILLTSFAAFLFRKELD